ncbi:MAG: tandem-95 repeat protein, partial [bacterium]|nr:tandem-95 repeat protein [bacterium]
MKRKTWLNLVTFVLLFLTVFTTASSYAKTVTGNPVTVKANYKSNSIWWNDLVIDITNNSSATINGWELEFDFPYTINNFNNANLNSNNNGHYSISNVGWGDGVSIEPGETISFNGGFSLNGDTASSDKLPASYIFNGTPIGGNNTPPTIAFLSPVNGEVINQNALSPIGISVSTNDTDGTVTDVKIEIEGKTLTGSNVNWTPSRFGTFTIKGTATDDKGAATSTSVSVTVKEIVPNVNPTVKITSPANGAVIEQTNLSPISITIDPKDSDGTITSSSISVNGKEYSGTSASFTPSKFGTFTITASATDNKDATATDSIQITVKQKETPNESPTVNFVKPINGQVFKQEALSPIDIVIEGKDSDGEIVESKINADGINYNGSNVTFTPSAFGTVTIIATVTDDNGAIAEKSIQIKIEKIDVTDPPAASNDSGTTNKNESVTINVLNNDTGDKIILDSVTTPANGTSFAFVDSVLYTPFAGFIGNDSFTYTIKDSSGRTAVATVNVVVNQTNDPNEVSFKINNVTVTFRVYPEEEPWYGIYHMTGSITGANPGWNMTVNYPNAQEILYATGTAATGAEFNQLDNYGGSGSGDFALYVMGTPGNILPQSISFNGSTPSNNPPVAEDDSANVVSGKAVTIDVLSNDTDEDGDELTITEVTAPTLGTAEIKDRAILYTANSDIEGTDTFSYTISDGNGGEASAEVSVKVTKPEPNKTPVVTIASPLNNQTIEQTTLSPVTISITSSDEDGTIEATQIEVDGQKFDNQNSAAWTPTKFGNHSIVVKVIDNEGAAAIAIATVIIKQIEDPDPEPTNKQIIGYINQWDGWKGNERGLPKQGALNQTNIDWTKYTMVNFAFFGVAKDGSLHSGDYRNKNIYKVGETQEPAELIYNDKYSSFDLYFLKNTDGAKSIFDLAKENNVKLMASIGGWSMCKHFPETASDPVKKAQFIAGCKELINMGFDGIDIDWEYPGQKGMNIESASEADYHNYTLLLQDIRAAIGSDKLLTSAINCMPSNIEKLEWSEIDKYLDYYNMMTYDIDGGWSEKTGHNSPLYDWKDASNTDNNISWDKTFKYLTQDQGIAPAKINM